MTVAVVDGNEKTRQGLVRRLGRSAGISVVGEAGDPNEVLAVVRERRPDVVVMDLRRMASDAAEFLGRLVAAVPPVGVVVLTAFLTERERVDLVQAGAGAILFKEIDSETLVQAIRTVAGRATAGRRRSEA